MNIKYDLFHKCAKIQKKVISKDNFTYRNIVEILEKNIKNEKQKILDYGCGVGTLDFFMASKGHKVRGLDVSKYGINMCKKNAEVLGLTGNLRFDEAGVKIIEKFDLIICIEVIEHVKNDRALIKKLARLLKKRGILILSTPSVNAPLNKLGLAKSFDKKVGHLRRYNLEQLRKIFGVTGLKIIEAEKREGLLRNSLFLFPCFTWMIKYLKGPFSTIVTFIDDISIRLFGESNLFIIATKK